jgi:3-oxoacyl-(acyl-carrier-protein) synthase
VSAALTGAALRAPLANHPEAFVRRLLAGERAFPARIAGEPSAAHHRRWQLLGRVERFAVDAAKEALGERSYDGDRLAIFWATGGLRVRWDETRPALIEQRPDGQACWERGLRLLHPFWLLQHLSNNAHALLAADLGAHGGGGVWSGANAGAQALAAAGRALAAGAIDVALVVGCDSLLAPEVESDPAWRQVVPGEGAAALVLERAGGRVRVEATSGAGPGALAPALARLMPGAAPEPRLLDGELAAATGHLGAATSLVQTIALAGLLERDPAARAAVAVTVGPPELVGAVKVELA